MFEHIIRTPFDMKPVFKPCERPIFNANNTDIFIQAQKRIELDNLGKNIYFETPLAVEEQLVFKTAQRLGLFNQKSDYRVLIDCDNITQLGMAIEDDVVIMHEGKLFGYEIFLHRWIYN